MATSKVDLTETKVLTRDKINYNLKEVWEAIHRENLKYLNSDERDKGIIPTGQSDEREFKRMYLGNEHNYCDCCGSLIRRKPYEYLLDTSGGLCNRCAVGCGFVSLDASKKLFTVPPVKSAVIRIDGEKRRG
jgi:hypothetical protein